METGPTLHRAYRQLISIHCIEERQLAGEANSRIPYSCCCDYEFNTPERYTTDAPWYMQPTGSLMVWRLVRAALSRHSTPSLCVCVRAELSYPIPLCVWERRPMSRVTASRHHPKCPPPLRKILPGCVKRPMLCPEVKPLVKYQMLQIVVSVRLRAEDETWGRRQIMTPLLETLSAYSS